MKKSLIVSAIALNLVATSILVASQAPNFETPEKVLAHLNRIDSKNCKFAQRATSIRASHLNVMLMNRTYEQCLASTDYIEAALDHHEEIIKAHELMLTFFARVGDIKAIMDVARILEFHKKQQETIKKDIEDTKQEVQKRIDELKLAAGVAKLSVDGAAAAGAGAGAKAAAEQTTK